MIHPHPQSVPIPPGVRVERWPAWMRMPAAGETGVRCGDVIYVSDVQLLRLQMGESVAIIDVSRYADVFNGPLPPMPESGT